MYIPLRIGGDCILHALTRQYKAFVANELRACSVSSFFYEVLNLQKMMIQGKKLDTCQPRGTAATKYSTTLGSVSTYALK